MYEKKTSTLQSFPGGKTSIFTAARCLHQPGDESEPPKPVDRLHKCLSVGCAPRPSNKQEL